MSDRFLRPSLLPVLLVALAAAGCHDSDEMMAPAGTTTVELHYDGDNFDSPRLPPATWEAAARFTAAQTGPLAGGKLVEVRFFPRGVPDSCRVKVYGPGTADSPGALLYEADVTAGLVVDDWNTHTLQTPVTIPNGDLWVAVEFSHASFLRVIGCDAGPAVGEGDWLFSSTDGTWRTFQQRYSESVNWNVRAVAEVAM